MKLLDIINKPNLYYHGLFVTDSFNDVINSDDEEQFIITEVASIIKNSIFEKLVKKYYVSEIFDLSNCYLGTHIIDQHFMFIHLVRNPINKFKVSLYSNSAHSFRDDVEPCENRIPCIPTEYRMNYLDYLNELDKWIEQDIIPENKKLLCEFRCLEYSNLYKDIIYPNFYSEYNDKIRAILKNENLLRLEDVADIIESTFINEKGEDCVRMLRYNKFPFYPFDIDSQTEFSRHKTSLVLQKGDIIKHGDNYFLMNVTPEYNIYVPHSWNVIRPKNINPEYLYVYLTSIIGRKMYSALCEVKLTNRENSKAQIIPFNKFFVVVPKKEDRFYIDEFNRIINPYNKYYDDSDYIDDDPFANILKQSCLQYIRNRNNQLLVKQIEEDFNELYICYRNKAYKSALIMTGAILEAFVLDWLSEIYKTDYFEENENVMIFRKRDKALELTVTKDLKDYIDLIKQTNQPNWDDEYNKANAIRQQRNLVHTKVCLKKSVNINAELCLKMINYLKDVVQSRKVDI